jgi:hypothetical protein
MHCPWLQTWPWGQVPQTFPSPQAFITVPQDRPSQLAAGHGAHCPALQISPVPQQTSFRHSLR